MIRTLCIAAFGLGLLAPSVSFAQDRGGGRGGFDMARFQEERLNRMKNELGATDEEWQVIKPKIEKVWTTQFASLTSRFGGFGRGRGGDRAADRGGDRGGDRGAERGGDRGGDAQAQSPTRLAQRELNDALENKDTPAEQIVAKLAALREARAKAKAELEAAQSDLQSVLTPRQEAALVAAGTLE